MQVGLVSCKFHSRTIAFIVLNEATRFLRVRELILFRIRNAHNDVLYNII